MFSRSIFQILIAAFLTFLCCSAVIISDKPVQEDLRKKALKAYNNGNYKDAYDIYTKLVLDPDCDKEAVGNDLNYAISCLQSLNRIPEVDSLREKAIDLHKENWLLLWYAAKTFSQGTHYGYMVANEFKRGNIRGSGKYMRCNDRDRIHALRLMSQAMDCTPKEKDEALQSLFFFDFAGMFLTHRDNRLAWRLQSLTDISETPDFSPGYYYGGYDTPSAPVDEKGNPVLYQIPEKYEDAINDGERWRWLLDKSSQLNLTRKSEVQIIFADFLKSQFGVQTLASYQRFFDSKVDEAKEAGIFSLHPLTEEETIARLATGVKKLTLPDGFRYIAIYRELGEGPESSWGEIALNNLAQIFENRRQYKSAAKFWLESIERYGPGHDNYKQQRLKQIQDAWGQIMPVLGQPADKGATIDYRFRNGVKVDFEAFEVDVEDILTDIKDYLKSNPSSLKWDRFDFGDIGFKLISKQVNKYKGKKVASWSLDLKPRNNHFDKIITVATPLQKAGVYMLNAKMKDGNESSVVIWVNDTVIVKKRLDKGAWYYVADASTGKPIPKANVEFFGYKRTRVTNSIRKIIRNYDISTVNFSEFTDSLGQVILDPKKSGEKFNWLAISRTESGRLAFLGFSNIWYRNYKRYNFNTEKSLFITDRPVYRPGNTVNIKCWLRHADYGHEDRSSWSDTAVTLQINNPKGEKMLEKAFTTDAFGGFNTELTLQKDADLGSYYMFITSPKKFRGASFRVEEYKKPEFEVKIEAPTEPILLGEKIEATIKANYYFGAPVTKAKVKYKVLRKSHKASWYPSAQWDWFYGSGYWWFAYNYEWYPGWKRWGCMRPAFSGLYQGYEAPEVVLEGEGDIKEDGTLKILIDTSFAKEVYGDRDHSYEITAEVKDKSRRTIVGQGDVLVARKPFKVFAWVDKGYYKVGDTIRADFNAMTLDHKPVKGKGEVSLLRIKYDKDNAPIETKVQSWNIDTNEAGGATLQINASKAGQYRISFKVTDSKGHTEEGGYIFCIRGDGFDSFEYRFNHLELTTAKKEYAPGEKADLMISTEMPDSTVLLFVRPENGVYLQPKLLELKGKNSIEQIEIMKSDMPNFFVEAFTVKGGKIYNEIKEIVVPPEKRMLDVEVTPSKEQYKPGEKADVRISVKDSAGKPFSGSAVITIYDKSVEYISGGSNVPDIKNFFWKWRRSHNNRQQTSFNNRLGYGPVTTPAMFSLGVFGNIIDESPEGSKNENGDESEVQSDKGFLGSESKRRSRGRMSDSSAPAEMMRKSKAGPGGPTTAGPAAPSAVLNTLHEAGEDDIQMIEPTVRSKFADTAFWASAITTDADGFAEIKFTMPDNLTEWKVKTWIMGHGTKVGEATVGVKTAKNLLLRMQAPRFFVEKDEVVLSANLHNYLKSDKAVKAILELEGDTLEAMVDTTAQLNICANGEERVNWRVKVKREGEAVIRMKVLSDEESDAMEMRFPVYVHGMSKTVSFSGAVRPEMSSGSIKITVPKERRINDSLLEIRYSPSLAAAMVDALPYLAAYPYGCTEQTLNRFVPAVITRKILMDMGMDLKDIQKKRTNLNAQEIGDDKERAEQWKKFGRGEDRNPVFDQDLLDDIVKTGLARLTAMQNPDGGWGWFSGYYERSYPHTTSVVVHGLQTARENDLAIVPGVLEKGVAWLKRYQAEEVKKIRNAPSKTRPYKSYASNLDAFVYMVLRDEKSANQNMAEYLYRDRTKLSIYAKAMFSLALFKEGENDKAQMVKKNIEQYLITDDENQTAYLNITSSWWRWYGSEYEALAYYLKLLAHTEPKSEKASGIAKYLINNRKNATYWNSTRDTAYCLEALADYIRASEEDKPDMTIQILIDGKKHKEVTINNTNLFSFDNTLLLKGDAIESGKHIIEFKKEGKGPLYFNAYLTYFSLEDFITKAGLEVKVNRKYYRLIAKDKKIDAAGSRGQVVKKKVEKFVREEIENLGVLKSGDLVEIELEIDSKNDYEYLIFEDMKAAGFEPVQLRSGYTGRNSGLSAYMELRDERVCFFVRALRQGKHSVSYRMRAEIPGFFSALPTRASAMYAPELRANSDEIKIIIEDDE